METLGPDIAFPGRVSSPTAAVITPDGNGGPVVCALCLSAPRKYTCPRCNVPYCSVPCYQGGRHSACSELFYREAVLQALQGQETGGRREMEEMLLKLRDEQLQPEGVIGEEEGGMWDRLSRQEKEQFNKLLMSGHIGSLVPRWTPWWDMSPRCKIMEVPEAELELCHGAPLPTCGQDTGTEPQTWPTGSDTPSQINRDVPEQVLSPPEKTDEVQKLASHMVNERKDSSKKMVMKERLSAEHGHHKTKSQQYKITEIPEAEPEQKLCHGAPLPTCEQDSSTEPQTCPTGGDRPLSNCSSSQTNLDVPTVPEQVLSPLEKTDKAQKMASHMVNKRKDSSKKTVIKEGLSAEHGHLKMNSQQYKIMEVPEADHEQKLCHGAPLPTCGNDSGTRPQTCPTISDTMLTGSYILSQKNLAVPEQVLSPPEKTGDAQKSHTVNKKKDSIKILNKKTVINEGLSVKHGHNRTSSQDISLDEILRGDPRIDDQSIVSQIPPLLNSIPPMCTLTRNPSLLVRFTLVNVIYSYSFSLLRHNGDLSDDDDILDFLGTLLSVSGALSTTTVYNSTSQALKSAVRASTDPFLGGDEGVAVLAMEATAKILLGDGGKRYSLAALSHLYRLLGKICKVVTEEKDVRKGAFNAKKKCLFLAAWVNENGTRLAVLSAEVTLQYKQYLKDVNEMAAISQGLQRVWGGKLPPAKKKLIEEVN